MHAQFIDLRSLPGSDLATSELRRYFAQDEIDLRDITAIAKQDPIILANILFLVNEIFLKRSSPVVNTLSAAINLVGLKPLKYHLLSIKSLSEIELKAQSMITFELIKSRIYVASHLTQFWAEYMGQTSTEEIFCASMFTGIGDIAECLTSDNMIERSPPDVDSIESIQALYHFPENDVGLLPDSIQQVYENSSISQRLKLSIIVYHLVACLELGFSTQAFNDALEKVCDFIGISMHRAGYDFSQQVVEIDKQSSHQLFCHSHFLLSTNTERLNVIET